VTASGSDDTISTDRWRRIALGSSVASATLVVCILLALALARRLAEPIASIIALIHQIRRGDYRVKVAADTTGSGDMSELQRGVTEIAGRLSQLGDDLEGRVLLRTRYLEVARDEAVRSNSEKRRLIQRVNAAVEEERKHIAIELHDHLNAALIVVRLEAQRILELAATKSNGLEAEEIKQKAQAIVDLTKNLYEMGRSIVRSLRPEIIDTLGLHGAIEDKIHQYDRLHPQCRFVYAQEGDLSGVTSELAIAVDRLIQEAVSNAVKHSGAKMFSVYLRCFTEGVRFLRLEISDDGIGMESETSTPGIGLIGMRERVDSFGGHLEIETGPELGTMIIIEMPLTDDPE